MNSWAFMVTTIIATRIGLFAEKRARVPSQSAGSLVRECGRETGAAFVGPVEGSIVDVVVWHQFLAWIIVTGNTKGYGEILPDVSDRFSRGVVPYASEFLACPVVKFDLSGVDPRNMDFCLGIS